MEIKRIYHSWEKWEDYKAGFYDNISGSNKKEMFKDGEFSNAWEAKANY